ncbi:MAG: hypothetical protein PWP08_1594 [Methanofollis sp.]|nr:hypothetical protein [Methanofollis sp.]
MALSFFDAMSPADRERLATLEQRADVCEREAATCRYEARRIRQHYEKMVAVFGLEACAAHAQRQGSSRCPDDVDL